MFFEQGVWNVWANRKQANQFTVYQKFIESIGVEFYVLFTATVYNIYPFWHDYNVLLKLRWTIIKYNNIYIPGVSK